MVRTHVLVGIQPIAPGPCMGDLCLYLSFSLRFSPTVPSPPPHCPRPSHPLLLFKPPLQTRFLKEVSASPQTLQGVVSAPGVSNCHWLCVCVCVCVCVREREREREMTCDHRSESMHPSSYSPPRNAWHVGEAPYRSIKRNYKDIITASVYQALTMC